MILYLSTFLGNSTFQAFSPSIESNCKSMTNFPKNVRKVSLFVPRSVNHRILFHSTSPPPPNFFKEKEVATIPEHTHTNTNFLTRRRRQMPVGPWSIFGVGQGIGADRNCSETEIDSSVCRARPRKASGRGGRGCRGGKQYLYVDANGEGAEEKQPKRSAGSPTLRLGGFSFAGNGQRHCAGAVVGGERHSRSSGVEINRQRILFGLRAYLP